MVVFIVMSLILDGLKFVHAYSKPIVESINGVGKAYYLKKEELTELMIRQPLDPNSHVKTEKNVSVRILFSDGSVVTIGQNSDFEINAEEFDKETPVNALHRGRLHANIQKSIEDSNRKKIKFLINSKAAVFGVRGTDFSIIHNEKELTSEIHTFEGSVDLAKNKEDLNSGKFINVSESETSRATTNGLGSVYSFDREDYIRSIQLSEPEFAESFQSLLPRRFEWLNFRLATMYVRQSSGGSLVTGILSYNPHLRLFGPIGISGQFAVFPLKTKIEKKNYIGFSLDALMTIDIFSVLGFEVGAGIESWGKHGKPSLNLVGQTVFKFSHKSTIEGIHIGVSNYRRIDDSGDDDTLSIRAGLGVKL